MGDHSVHAHTDMYAPKLCPAIYCDSLVMAICVPSTDLTCSSTTSNNIPSPSPDRPSPSPAVPSSSSFSSPSSLASYLSSLGFELVGVTPSLVDDCAHSRPHTHTLTHVIYNKQYTDEEMRQLDDIAASIDSSVGKFHRGHDLNSLFSFGPDIWALCDHAACLDDTKYPNLRFFVDMAQLDEKVLQMYQQYVESTTPSSASIAASPSAVSTSSTSLTDSKSAAMPSPPPPPASPPSIPPPSCHTDTSDSFFKVVSWNILSSDYCHPSTFFYCSPDDLSWSHRSTRIRSILADESGDLELFQEVDYDSVANGEFDTVTHGSVYIRRPNHKRDGLLTRWRRSKFELLQLPQLVTLDARFAKNGTERRREKMEWRVTGVDSEPCSDQPRTYSTLAQRTTSGKAQRNGASATTTTSTSLDKQDTPNSTSSSDDDHRRHRNLMKRQSHILTCLEKVEARLDALTQVMRERFTQVRPDSVLPSALLATPPTPVLSSQSHSQSHPPHAHGHPHIAVMDKFHVIHFNDLSLLTRTKSNSTSSMFARYKKENIGLMLLFRHRATRRLILVVNVHLFWNPEYEDVKCAQAMFALQHIEEMKNQLALVYPSSEPVEVVFGGDFNSTPTSDVVRLMTQATAPIRVESVQPSEAAHQPKQIVSSSLHDIVFDTLPVDAATAPAPVSVSSSSSPSPPPFRLLLDSSLMKVTKWLRAIGIDTLCLPSSTPTSTDALDLARVIDEFFQVARRDERVIVTQNKSLLKRRGMPPRHFLLSANIKDPLDIFHSIVNEFRLRWDVERFYSICTTCNHLVRPLTRDEYLKFPFLPVEYRTGLDDDGAPLFLTECTGPSCRRVRWWSSKRQRESREKLFQVRLDMEVELTDDENENEVGATEEERVEEVAKVSPVTDPSSPKSSSPPPSSSLPNSSSVPFDKPSAADILAARVARKAAKAATKSERMQAAAVRRAANAETFNFHKFAEGAKLRGDDGEYLFDRKPTDHRAGLPTEVNGTSHVISSLSTLHASSDCPSTAMLESTTNSSLLGIHSGTTTASSELWWTSEKKQRMIQVERRIIVETRKLLHQKRAKQAKAKQQQSQEPESTKVTKNSSSRISPLTPALGSSSPSSPTSLSFSHALTQYWHSVVDHFVTPTGKNCHHVATDMRFQSVYPYQTQQQAEGRTDTGNAPFLDDPLDVPVTNCTPKFVDMIDYIFYTGASDLFQLSNSRRLCTRREFATLDLIGYPSSDWPSDHQLLAATFRMAHSE